jgi:5-methylcytosine-specific restriction endonuclease McrA
MSDTWTDYRGRTWKVSTWMGRLQFKQPGHAALRAHIFHRDGYRCVRCPAVGVDVPADYDGRYTLSTNTMAGDWPDVLVLDHILTLPAGGRNVVENFQTLCESCNKSKQVEDIAAAKAYREAHGR